MPRLRAIRPAAYAIAIATMVFGDIKAMQKN
jgi:hypothetical protein